ncbi:prolactin-inducible protein [Phodopus roborovskii]|uniref:Prolactin-inducible protein homolog n=1 Tax=Phodopus roborovskii TaxID=109678 RepID=A0AAV0AC01_PHORO|nr:prolactin-inducible protein [Phodopus roborovskii]CAH7469839.1 Pip [Phodopus roborovskii]
MHRLSLKLSAASLLILCLQLGINKAQDDASIRKPLIFYLDVPTAAKANDEISVRLGMITEYKECLVVTASLKSNVQMEGNFNFKQTRCICNDHRVNFYWDFPVTQTVTFEVLVEIVKEKNVCPDDVAVVPIIGDTYYTYRTVHVR